MYVVDDFGLASGAARWDGDLDDELVDRLAERIAERLRREPDRGELIDAAAVAKLLGCARSWVYEHRAELGAIRLGGGNRPRLRFDRARVLAFAAPRNASPEPVEPVAQSPRRRFSRRPSVPLLEIKDRTP
jgi:hypothetical protein